MVKGDILVVRLPDNTPTIFVNKIKADLGWAKKEAGIPEDIMIFVLAGPAKIDKLTDEMKDNLIRELSKEEKWKSLMKELTNEPKG